MKTKYQEVFGQITSNEAMKGIFPSNEDSGKELKKQIQNLFEKLSGEGITILHKNDYKYNIENNKNLIKNILSFGKDLEGKAQENFEKLKYSLLGVLIGKYIDICNKKGVKIDRFNHSKENGEKHGQDFLDFIKDVFDVSTSKKKSGITSFNLKDKQMFFMTQAFLQQANIQSLKDVSNTKENFASYISDEIEEGSENNHNQRAFVENVLIGSFAYEFKDASFRKSHGANEPHPISDFCFKSCSILFMSDEQEVNQSLKNAKTKIDVTIKQLNATLDKLEAKLKKCKDDKKEETKKELEELKKSIKNIQSSYENIVNGIVKYQEHNSFNKEIFEVFTSINKANEFNQQGKQGWLYQIEKNNFDEQCINNVEIDQLFKWNNDRKVSNIAEVNEKTIKIQTKNSDTDKEFKEESINFDNFLTRHAIYSEGNRPATNFFALLDIILKKEDENEKNFLIKFAKDKLIELHNQIDSKKIDKTTANKLLLPFYALEQFKKLNNNEKRKVVSYDKIEKFLPIYDEIIILCKKENKDFDLTKIANDSINSIRNDNSKSANEEIGNSNKSTSSARSDSLDSNSSFEFESLSSENMEDKQTEKQTESLSESIGQSGKSVVGPATEKFLKKQKNSILPFARGNN